jgi:glutathione S-transferase
MVTLYQFEAAFGVPSPSPFCMKLECFLRMAALPYRAAPLTDLGQAPKGKGPFIEEDGVRVGDSALIIRHLEAKHGVDLERGLTPAERAAAHAFGVMLEERTYFVMLHDRWIADANWPLVRDAYLGELPPAAQDEIRAGCRARLREQGLGAHAAEEMHALAMADIDALASWLGNRPFFMGLAPTKIDATVHAFVCNFLAEPFTTPLKDATRRHANLVAYNERMLQRFFRERAAAA